eukprot:scaffold27330_cov146-Isochrysis_galbana.AAC.1
MEPRHHLCTLEPGLKSEHAAGCEYLRGPIGHLAPARSPCKLCVQLARRAERVAPDAIDFLLNLKRFEIIEFRLVRLELGQKAVLRVLPRAQSHRVRPHVGRCFIRLPVADRSGGHVHDNSSRALAVRVALPPRCAATGEQGRALSTAAPLTAGQLQEHQSGAVAGQRGPGGRPRQIADRPAARARTRRCLNPPLCRVGPSLAPVCPCHLLALAERLLDRLAL